MRIEEFQGAQLEEVIRERLNEFNFKLVPHYQHEPLNLLVRDGEEVSAGLLGGTYWGWLYVSILWVREDLRNQRLGSRLLQKAEHLAIQRGCKHVHLETHDFQALAFYQKRGFRLAALRPNAVEASRKLKPEIPLLGENGIPIRDEIELEMDL